MWNKIKNIATSSWEWLNGKKRRIAVVGGKLSALGTLVGSIELQIIGGVVTVLFGSADIAQYSQQKIKVKKDERKTNK